MRADESSLPHLRIVACTGQHRGDRREQQDRVAVVEARKPRRCALGLLADGLGGRSGGALAAENVILAARNCFEDFLPGDQAPPDFFARLVGEVHTVVSLAALATGKEPHSTFAAVLVQPHRVDWCHVGDSRIYHFRGSELMHRTRDHTYAWQLEHEGRATRERARLHPSAQLLVNSIGGARAPWPDIGGIDAPGPNDRFLLCSDGLWAYFSPEELGSIIAALPCKQAAAKLIELARQRARGKGDNCSLVLMQLAEAPAVAAPRPAPGARPATR